MTTLQIGVVVPYFHRSLLHFSANELYLSSEAILGGCARSDLTQLEKKVAKLLALLAVVLSPTKKRPVSGTVYTWLLTTPFRLKICTNNSSLYLCPQNPYHLSFWYSNVHD